MKDKTKARKAGGGFSFRLLRVQILLLMLVCYLVPTLVLGVYLGGTFFTKLREQKELNLSTSAQHGLELTQQNLEHVVTASREATYDGELTTAWNGQGTGTIQRSECLRLTRAYLERKYSRDEFFTVALFLPMDGSELLYNRAGYEEAQHFSRATLEQVQQLAEGLDTRCDFLEVEGRLYLVRNLLNLRMERFGTLVLGLNQEQLSAALNEVADTWEASMRIRLNHTGDQGEDWTSLPQGLSEQGRGGDMVWLRRAVTDDFTLWVSLTVPHSRVYGELDDFRNLMIGLVLCLVPVILLISLYVHRRIAKPISILAQAARRIEAGEFGVTVPMQGRDELGQLGRAFSDMSTRTAELIDKTYKEEIALRDAQIRAMQSRINPHFINNALEAINWQARIDDSAATSDMIEALSVLLNASMARNDRMMVPLREEMEVADAYIYFITRRFGQRLTVEKHIDPEALDEVVPLLTIQPVLENAVEHGISPAGGGEIDLVAQRLGSCLRLELCNSGAPITEEDRQRIDTALSGNSQGGSHLGLSNIAMRLRLIYGGRAAIQVFTDKGGKTVVRMDVPCGGDGGKGGTAL